MAFTPLNIKTIFKRTSEGIENEDEYFSKIYIHEISNDSVVVSYETENSTKEVFKKQNQPQSKIRWNPENKSYEFEGNNGLVNIKFLENGLYVDCLPGKNDVSVGHWHTIEEKNNLFIVLDNINVIALAVDSLKNDKVFLSIHDKAKFDYTLAEQSLEMPQNLLGDWILVGSDYHNGFNPPPLPNGFEWPTIEYLIINNDSVVITKNGSTSSKKWILGGRNDLIIFPNETAKKNTISNDTLTPRERRVRRNILKIDSLSDTELILLAEYEFQAWNGFERKLKFRRGKTKADKAHGK